MVWPRKVSAQEAGVISEPQLVDDVRYTPATAAYYRERGLWINPDHIIDEDDGSNKGTFIFHWLDFLIFYGSTFEINFILWLQKYTGGSIIFYVQLRLEQIYGLINPFQPQVGKRGISFILRWWAETGQPMVWPVVTQKQFERIYWNSAQARNQELLPDIKKISAIIVNYNS